MTRDSVSANWSGIALVCGKCSRKVGGGFGPKGRTSLARALRALLPKAKGRKSAHGVIETGCLRLCPKRRVVAIDAARSGEWLLIAPGTPVELVAARLGINLEVGDHASVPRLGHRILARDALGELRGFGEAPERAR